MDDKTSTFLVIILAISGLTMMTALLICYACIFRDLCCRLKNRSKRQRRRDSLQREFDHNKARLDAIPLNDITQGDSLPTESEKI